MMSIILYIFRDSIGFEKYIKKFINVTYNDNKDYEGFLVKKYENIQDVVEKMFDVSGKDHYVIHIHTYDYTVPLINAIKKSPQYNPNKYQIVVYDYPAEMIKSEYDSIILSNNFLENIHYIDTLQFSKEEIDKISLGNALGDYSYISISESFLLYLLYI